jgi:hypothetical protein
MTNYTKAHLRRHKVAGAVCAALGLMASMPALSADAEVEALRQELAAQRKLIEQLLANQKQASPLPSSAEDEQRRVADKAKQPAAPVPVTTNAVGLPAGTSLRIYGVADVSVTNTNSGFGHKTRIEGGGGYSASRLGIQITRDLPAGMQAIALAEGGVQFSTGSTGAAAPATGINVTSASSGGAPGTGPQIFARQIFGGLKGNFGQVSIGRQYTGSYIGAAVIGASHGDGLYGNSGTVTPLVGGMPTRVNNSLGWITPKLGGLYGWVTAFTGAQNNIANPVVAGATTTTDQAGRGVDLAGIYTVGKLTAAITAWSLYNNSYASAGETGLAKKKGYQLAGNYDFGPAKLFGSYVHGTISGGNYENVTKALSNASAYTVSALVPVGLHMISLSYTRLDDKSQQNRDGQLYGVSWWYPLAKDTNVYASIGRQVNNSNASYSLADGGDLVGNAAGPGGKPNGVQLGINFTF